MPDSSDTPPRRLTERAAEQWLRSCLVAFDPIAFGLFGIPPATPDPSRSRPARPPRPPAPPPERYYVGRRTRNARAEVFLVDARVEPLPHGSFRSDAPFDWGAAGAGTDELAYAILNHASACPPPEDVCRQFAHVLACLDRAGFVLSCEEVLLWVVTAIPSARVPTPTGSADASGSGRTGLLARATVRIRRWLARRGAPDVTGRSA